MSSPLVSSVIAIEKRVRQLGMAMYMDTNGELMVMPGNVAEKHPELMRKLHENEEAIKKWLTIVAK